MKLNSGINCTVIYSFLMLVLEQLPKSWTAPLLLYYTLCFCIILRLFSHQWTSFAVPWSVPTPGHHSPTEHSLCIPLWFLLTPRPLRGIPFPWFHWGNSYLFWTCLIRSLPQWFLSFLLASVCSIYWNEEKVFKFNKNRSTYSVLMYVRQVICYFI